MFAGMFGASPPDTASGTASLANSFLSSTADVPSDGVPRTHSRTASSASAHSQVPANEQNTQATPIPIPNPQPNRNGEIPPPRPPPLRSMKATPIVVEPTSISKSQTNLDAPPLSPQSATFGNRLHRWFSKRRASSSVNANSDTQGTNSTAASSRSSAASSPNASAQGSSVSLVNVALPSTSAPTTPTVRLPKSSSHGTSLSFDKTASSVGHFRSPSENLAQDAARARSENFSESELSLGSDDLGEHFPYSESLGSSLGEASPHVTISLPPLTDAQVPTSPLPVAATKEDQETKEETSSTEERKAKLKIQTSLSVLGSDTDLTPCTTPQSPRRPYAMGISRKKIVDGTVAGPESFEVVKLLGRGDVGKVYMVSSKANGRVYAMKVLSKKEMVRRNKVKRCIAEREILSKANHPFIVSLYHSFQSVNHVYFVIEYCCGGEFFRALQKQPGKCLQEDDARFYVAEVVMALEYLHLMGYVYRDLKPENILLHASGHIMLADFDLAKATSDNGEPEIVRNSSGFGSGSVRDIDTRVCVGQARTNSFVGTEEYLAPEVVCGRGHTSAVDWWTLGILTYEMLYGATPFKGHSRAATFHRIMNDAVGFPNSPIVSSAGKHFVRRLLHKDEKKRIGSHHGASDVKAHPFFRKTNFALLRNMVPPIIPKVTHPMDTINFRSIPDLDGVPVDDEICKPDSQDPFANFDSISFVDPADEYQRMA